MCWAALILAGTVLAQIPPNSPGQPTVPRYSEPAPPGVGGYGTAGGIPMPGGGAGGMQGSDAGSGLAPLRDWQAGDPRAAAPLAAPPAGSATGGQPQGDINPAPGAQPVIPPGSSPTLERLLFLQKNRDDKAAAQGEVAPSLEPPYPAQQPPSPGPGSYGTGWGDPAVPSRIAAQLPTVPRLTVDEALRQAMSLPTSTVVAGRNVTLLDVLGQVTDRSKRVAIAHAYWQLAARLGEYRFCWEESRLIQSIGAGAVEAGLLRSAQQVADRESTAAELALLQAQYDLAEAAGLDSSGSGQLPLPSDRPHTRSYNTNFDQIFAGRTPPGRTRLLHRTLPLQQRVIDARWEAVQAALDAYQAVARSYQAGQQVDAADLLATLHEITTQRRAWMTAIAQYNHGIADYALTIAGPETKGRDLVSILIKLSQAEPGSDRVAPGEGAKPGTPTLAPPRDQVTESDVSLGVPPIPLAPIAEADLAVEPTSAEEPARADGATADDSAVKPALAEVPAKLDSEGNTLEPGAMESDAALAPARDLAIQARPMVPVEETGSASRVQTVFRQPDSSSSIALVKQHGDLIGLPAGIQAKRLTASLLGDFEAGRPEAEVVDLEACLEGAASGRRRAIIEAYWEASQSLAEYEVYRNHVELLANLIKPVTLGSAGTDEARARLKAARLSAEADLLEAETRLIATQYELTSRCGRSLQGPWLMPKTLPHAGDYRLNLEAQPAQIVESWGVRRLATIIPALHRSLSERAAAVVEADSRRVEVVNTYWSQSLPFDRVLAAVGEQTRESLEFLKVLGAYNQSIADYVTAVIPETLPEEQLVATLVVR